jgi:hypothetical protein
MLELPNAFLREVGIQSLLIGVFLGGISVSILGNLIVSDNNGKLIKVLIIGLTISSLSFIMTIMSSYELILILTEGWVEEVNPQILRQTGKPIWISLFLGLFSLIFVISLSGWLKGRKLGIITTILGIITLLFLILTLFD